MTVIRRKCTTYRLRLERLNRLDLRAHVIRDGLEPAEELLGFVYNGFVLQHRTVVREVDRRRRRCSLRVDALGIRVPLAEGLQRRDGLCI